MQAPITSKGAQRLRAELDELKSTKRPAVIHAIAEARAHGDLKENAEYHAAKEEAAHLEAKIAGLRDQLRSAEIVEHADGDVAGMGTTVTYKDEKSGKELSHKLVPKVEADPSAGLISIDSPVGKALAGRKVGDDATLETPSGVRTMRVLAVEHS